MKCYAAGKGTRSISDLLDISRNTVKKYINTLNQSGMTMEEMLAMDEAELMTIFQEDPIRDKATSQRYDELMAKMPEYARQLRKHGMTKLRVYEQYLRDFPDGYKDFNEWWASLSAHPSFQRVTSHSYSALRILTHNP